MAVPVRAKGVDYGIELVIGEGLHPAVGVVDKDDLFGAQQSLADRERPDLVLGNDTPRIADDMGLALVQPQNPVDIQPRIHTRDDREVPARRQRQRARELSRICLVVFQ